MYRLDEVCTLKQWKTISIKELTPDGYPVYGANGIIGYYKEYNHSEPTLCITCRGATCGALNITKPFSYINGNTMALDNLNTSKISLKFLYYYLKSRKLNDVISGSAQPQITRSSLSRVMIPKFQIEIQKKISNILDYVVEIIEKNKKRIILLEELVKSRFIEMFGDTIKNDKGWEVKKWEEVLKIINGKNQKKVENESGKYDIFGSGGKMGKADDWLVKENSVLIGRKGSINKPIIVKERIWNVDTVFGLEPNIEIINCDYLYYFCYFYDFERLNKAVTIPSLTKKDLLKIDIPIPPLVLQEKFVLIHKSINKLKFEAEKALKEMENLYESLMQKFFKQN